MTTPRRARATLWRACRIRVLASTWAAGATLLATSLATSLTTQAAHAAVAPDASITGTPGTPAETTDATPAPLAVTAAAALPHSVAYSTRDYDWTDTARARRVPVRLYLPDAAQAGRPVPLIVFSHGIGGSRMGYTYLGRHWASQGYASLHLQHIGSDRSLWGGNPFALAGRLKVAAAESEAVARVQDLRFALDQVLAGDLASRLDSSRIVAAGHSYGANTTLLAVGARVERHGQVLDFRDPRIAAAIVLSAPPFYGDTDAARILGGVTVPTLHITATEDVIRVPGYYSGAGDRVAVFEATGSVRKALAVFAGGSHSMFTDRANTGGATLNPQVKAATRELSMAFLKSVFDGEDSALAQWPQRFGGLLARFSHSVPATP
jgi:dienelactone hydrolase